MSRTLVLASSSPYRRELLSRLQLPFELADPKVDESPLSAESPPQTAHRLALCKARAVTSAFPDALIIGSDQVACAGQETFDKPLERPRAIMQLRAMRGRSVIFHTALCVLDSANGLHQLQGVPTEVRFRQLADAEIERYVDAERPFHCAGSAKVEGLGISLLEYARGDDPTALIGLPLISLCRMLREYGIAIP